MRRKASPPAVCTALTHRIGADECQALIKRFHPMMPFARRKDVVSGAMLQVSPSLPPMAV